ncbi:MAG: DUF255 domain-containing protein [Deltaproteobacteria bacterium]|nr:DUF255 domain-containing protein [Deltaproteobacteria bacterium]
MRRLRLKSPGLGALGLLAWVGLLGVGGGHTDSPANRLAGEASPYLQLHAHNPVDWYPWGEEAFARARAEDKLVFLSVGYSTCYWCHVMERGVFSNPEIAAQMNAHFISIKVDREERPDIDDVYMKATHLLTGSGGWPNSVFLTPEGKPFHAGTYYPPEDRHGRPGFPRVLRSLHEAWSGQRAEVLKAAEQVTRRLQMAADLGAVMSTPPPPVKEMMEGVLAQLSRDFDADHGGFGRRTKFPRPPSLGLLLTHVEQETDPDALRMLTITLDAMALGGIYDQLADGFHRYSTEPSWSIPHFEKMLYDNAQLVSVYARAYTLTARPLYRRVVERTLAYLDREMSLPEGGFVSAQDAEVDAEEGASYVWTRSEIEDILGKKQASALLSVYELAPMPEEGGKGVLRVQRRLVAQLRVPGAGDVAALLAGFDEARDTLLTNRQKRKQPLRDDKVLAAWNGLAIRGLVDASAALGEPAYLRRAERAATFVLARLLAEDGSLRRSYVAGQAREAGVLDDYAFLADGLLALHGATGNVRWQTAARKLIDGLLDHFEDASGGGFFLTPETSDLLVRPKPFEDQALPAGNGVALRVLQRLAMEPGSTRYASAAGGIASSASALLRRAPHAAPTVVAALASAPEKQASRAFRLPRSKDHVSARLLGEGEADARELVMRITIDEGWHVNAHPASLSNLLPTTIEALEDDPVGIPRYPLGRSFRPEFAEEAIQVYDGTLEVPIAFENGVARPDRLALRIQACDELRCLPPDRIVVTREKVAGETP